MSHSPEKDMKQPSGPNKIPIETRHLSYLFERALNKDSFMTSTATDDNKQTRPLTAISTIDLLILITDHNRIDYEMVSDFLLTFRMFMSADSLLEVLLARFAWACRDHNPQSVSPSVTLVSSPAGGNKTYQDMHRSIAIRTFVVLRHWILNFFPDDFVPNFNLRSKFVSAINSLYSLPCIESDAHYKHMLHQLKQAWMGLCCMYWDLGAFEVSSFDLTLPLFPGGKFGQKFVETPSVKQQLTKEMKSERRKSLLSFYDSPIEPVLYGNAVPRPVAGDVVKGGIALFCDVQVDNIKPPTPVKRVVLTNSATNPTNSNHTTKRLACPLAAKSLISTHNKHSNTSNQLWSNTKSIGIIAKISKILDNVVRPSKLDEDSQEEPLGPMRIDMLCARVIEELNEFLDPSRQNSYAEPKCAPPLSQLSDGFNTEQENGSPVRKSPAYQLNVARRRARQRLSMSGTGHRSSTGKSSYVSYDSYTSSNDQSFCNHNSEPLGDGARLKRAARLSNLRAAATANMEANGSGMSYPSDSLVYGRTMSSSSDLFLTGESLVRRSLTTRTEEPQMQSNMNNIMYSGIDSDVANELAAISDEDLGGDAVATALLKLEGNFVRPIPSAPIVKVVSEIHPIDQPSPAMEPQSDSYGSSMGTSVQYSSMHNSNLFKAAFESKMDIAALRKPSTRNSSSQRDVSLPPSCKRNDLQPGAGNTLTPQRTVSDSVLICPTVNGKYTHASFILRYSSKEICDQLTLIEKDALAEIDWKELVELTWRKEVTAYSSWLQVLAGDRAHGVELVIARFNLVVNWIKSEIVMTNSLEERAQTIARFIHVAHIARRTQNYATAMQVVLALSSTLIVALKETWAALGEDDKEILTQVTELMSPFSNFGRLRACLRDSDTDQGCIPFVGLYLSDLTFNNERSPAQEGVINFHKYQVGASITKSLLQCIEWSNRYCLKANTELMAKCLYIRSLTQEEMEQYAATIK